MKQESEQGDLRIKIYQQYFHCQQSLTKDFVGSMFKVLENDQTTQQIFLRDLVSFLSSSYRHSEHIFQYCLRKQQKKYFSAIVQFLRDYFNVNTKKNQTKATMVIARNLQIFIIQNIWKPIMKAHREDCGINVKKILVYLSLKMRSLDAEIRYHALQSFYHLVQFAILEDNQQIKLILNQTMPKMVQKQTLVKKVSYSKGVLLQILQDQHHHIKKRCIELLGFGKMFFQIKILQPLVLYMLNDEHKSVRQTSLLVLTQIKPLNLQKEDLTALLMCLRQKNIQLRGYVFQTILNIDIKFVSDFQTILQKLFQTLMLHRVDKKKVYTTCGKLGKKYPQFVLEKLDKILNYKEQEPNWKNLIYKAKVILVASIGKDKWPSNRLPNYFSKHYLYIRDMQYYVFEEKKLIQNELWRQNQIKLQTSYQLRSFIQSQGKVRIGFAQEIFKVLKVFLQKGAKKDVEVVLKLMEQLRKIEVKYNMKKHPKGEEIVNRTIELINGDLIDTECLKSLLNLLQQQQLNKIPLTVFKVSNDDSKCIIISNNAEIMKRSFIEFWTLKQKKYIRMSEVEYEDRDEEICYFKANFQWKKVKCIIIYSSDPIQEYETDRVG